MLSKPCVFVDEKYKYANVTPSLYFTTLLGGLHAPKKEVNKLNLVSNMLLPVWKDWSACWLPTRELARALKLTQSAAVKYAHPHT